MKKLAVVFPGLGYHADKPLLYYSKKAAASQGFEVVEASYEDFPKDVKKSKEKMEEALESALRQSEIILRDIDFKTYDTILFLSKSIGTAVAAAYAEKNGLQTANVFYTPIEASLTLMKQSGIIFHGTKDPWLDTNLLHQYQPPKYKVYLIENANHSLETGDVILDLKNMNFIMSETMEYIKSKLENKYKM